MKSCYIYLVPKSKWPKKFDSELYKKNIYRDYDFMNSKILGFEFIKYSSIEVNGVDIEKELKTQKGKRWMAEARRISSDKKSNK